MKCYKIFHKCTKKVVDIDIIHVTFKIILDSRIDMKILMFILALNYFNSSDANDFTNRVTYEEDYEKFISEIESNITKYMLKEFLKV